MSDPEKAYEVGRSYRPITEAETGERKGHYLNVTAPTFDEMMKRAEYAKEIGEALGPAFWVADWKRLNRNMHADEEAWYRIPADRDLSAQYLLLYELSLPYGLDLNDRINVDKSETRITATISRTTTTETTAPAAIAASRRMPAPPPMAMGSAGLISNNSAPQAIAARANPRA